LSGKWQTTLGDYFFAAPCRGHDGWHCDAQHAAARR